MLLVFLSLFSIPAQAGDITIHNTGPRKVYVWLDGQPAGRLRPDGQRTLPADTGLHEVAIAPNPDPTLLYCRGLVDVFPEAAVVALGDGDCSALMSVGEADDTISRGTAARVTFSLPTPLWASVDGARPLRLDQPEAILNVTPGAHTIRYATQRHRGAWYEQDISPQPDAPMTIACDTEGCAEEYIAEADAAADLGVSPEAAGDLLPPESDLGTPENMPIYDVSLAGAAGEEGDHFCCVGTAFYGCPTAEAVLECVGTSEACMEQCDGDLLCLQECAGTAEANPGVCARTPARDQACR